MEVNGSRHTQENGSGLLGTLFSQMAVGNIDALDSYLVKTNSINRRDENGMALIHYAACHGNTRLIYRLMQYGAEMNLRDDGTPPWKPVHYAIFHRQHEAERLLIELGAQAPLPIVKQVIAGNRRFEPVSTPLAATPDVKGITSKQPLSAATIQSKDHVAGRLVLTPAQSR